MWLWVSDDVITIILLFSINNTGHWQNDISNTIITILTNFTSNNKVYYFFNDYNMAALICELKNKSVNKKIGSLE